MSTSSSAWSEFGGGFMSQLGKEVASALVEWIKRPESRETAKKVAMVAAGTVVGVAAGVLIVGTVIVAPEAVIIVVFA
ncbi:hypothetical protein [Streptomyces sp. NPDC000888]